MHLEMESKVAKLVGPDLKSSNIAELLRLWLPLLRSRLLRSSSTHSWLAYSRLLELSPLESSSLQVFLSTQCYHWIVPSYYSIGRTATLKHIQGKGSSGYSKFLRLVKPV